MDASFFIPIWRGEARGVEKSFHDRGHEPIPRPPQPRREGNTVIGGTARCFKDLENPDGPRTT